MPTLRLLCSTFAEFSQKFYQNICFLSIDLLLVLNISLIIDKHESLTEWSIRLNQ